MLNIALGTTSKWKIDVLKEVIAETKIDTEFVGISVDTGVLNQPRNENETKEGSINRARKALEIHTESEVGMGIEFGYEPKDNIFLMHAYSSIVDKEGNVYTEQSSTLELPKYFYPFLHEGDEVGYHVQDYKDLHDEKSWKYFSEIIQFRLPFIKESARNALIRYYFRKEY